MPQVLANERRENKGQPPSHNAAGWLLYSKGVITHTRTHICILDSLILNLNLHLYSKPRPTNTVLECFHLLRSRQIKPAESACVSTSSFTFGAKMKHKKCTLPYTGKLE